MNLIELQRSLRQLRLGGMAHALEPRILEAQSSQMAPIDFLSTLVSDELTIRSDRLLAAPDQARAVSRARQDPRRLRFRLQQEDESPPRLRARHRPNSSIAVKTRSSSVHQAPERAISLRPSASQPSARAIALSTARPTSCSRNSPTPPSTALASRKSSSSRPCRC